MNQSVIVYGPPGCGKTRYAERIAKHFGLETILDDINPARYRVPGYGVLALVTSDGAKFPKGGPFKSFAEVAQQINAAIPLTELFDMSVQPVNEGVYQLINKHSDTPHWSVWRGEWKFTADSKESASLQDRTSWTVYDCPEDFEGWRGLAEEPILLVGA